MAAGIVAFMAAGFTAPSLSALCTEFSTIYTLVVENMRGCNRFCIATGNPYSIYRLTG